MVIVYYDESGLSRRDEYFALAAMVGSDYDWKIVGERWQRALADHDVPYLHMREFAHRTGPFKGWSEFRRRSLLGACLTAIHSRPIMPIATAMEASAEVWFDRKGRETKAGPLVRCFYETVGGAMRLCGHLAEAGTIQGVYSRQDQFRNVLSRLYDTQRQSVVNSRIPPLSFEDMRGAPGLQAADLLAYELTHFYHLKRRRPELPIRVPYAGLLYHASAWTRSRLHYIKYLPKWQFEAERDGSWQRKREELYVDMNAARERILEFYPYPVDFEVLKENERIYRSGVKLPHWTVFPPDSFPRRRRPQPMPPKGERI